MTGVNASRWMVVAAVLAAASWFVVGLIAEAYGSGPPHYGGTTNMDKWTSPWPTVILVVGVAALLIAFVTPWRSLKRNRRERQ